MVHKSVNCIIFYLLLRLHSPIWPLSVWDVDSSKWITSDYDKTLMTLTSTVWVGEPGGAEKGERKAVPLPRNNLAQGLDTQTATHTHAGMHTHTHTIIHALILLFPSLPPGSRQGSTFRVTQSQSLQKSIGSSSARPWSATVLPPPFDGVPSLSGFASGGGVSPDPPSGAPQGSLVGG